MRCVQICDKVQGMHIWDVVGTGSRTTVDVSTNRYLKDIGLHLLRPVRHPLSHWAACSERDDTGKVF